MHSRLCLLACACLVCVAPAARAADGPMHHRPDPLAVQRYGPAYRYPQAGWIVLHVEGEPYKRGYQQGRLMAPEIVAYITCSAAQRSHTSPADGWKLTRSLVNALFVRRYEREYLEEMKGIADGATAAGARFDNRAIDLVDIVTLNAWPEIETLDPALDATPTGLEGLRFPKPDARPPQAPQEMHCSAFAANGPATTDGKVVFGHITMFGLYPSLFFNVWLDVKPAHGHRVLMQSYPGGIESGMDYYLNDAGLLVCETTIKQTRFDASGAALASRIRQALQYADSIDKAVEILKAGNNGLYTNEWLLADTKTNEIAMFELGTAKSRLYRSSRGEWFGGTEGFYWGCNNTKDLDVRLETYPGVNDAPANPVWHPSDRDRAWVSLYKQWRGRIDAEFGRTAFTTPPIAACVSLDAKVTTTDLARNLQTWALFGPPLGKSWQPTDDEKKKYPEVRAMASNPWTVLVPDAPAASELAAKPADIHERVDEAADALREAGEKAVRTGPAWHGTLLPRADADAWLAAAFAEYERIVGDEDARRAAAKGGRLSAEDRNRIGVELFGNRSAYQAAVRASADTPLSHVRAAVGDDDWYRIASGKGVLLLNDLRGRLGHDAFIEFMDRFGREHAGKEVSTADFVAAAAGASGAVRPALEHWLAEPGLPRITLESATATRNGSGYRVEGALRLEGGVPGGTVEVTVEAGDTEVTRTVRLDGASTRFSLETKKKPKRVIVDKYGAAGLGNGGPYGVLSFFHDLANTIIVYGTADEVASNRETAERLQQAIVRMWCNCAVPVKSDAELTEDDWRSNHVLLVGRPDTNRAFARLAGKLPVAFGARSFSVRGQAYAHARSAVIAAAENPVNSRYSVVVFAGLSPDAMLALPAAMGRNLGGEVVLLAHGAKPQQLVVAPPERVRELDEGARARR